MPKCQLGDAGTPGDGRFLKLPYTPLHEGALPNQVSLVSLVSPLGQTSQSIEAVRTGCSFTRVGRVPRMGKASLQTSTTFATARNPRSATVRTVQCFFRALDRDRLTTVTGASLPS